MGVRTESAYPLISIPEAQEIVARETHCLPQETVHLASAVGRTLAEDVVAIDDLPPFPASIKDGYAVRAADGTGTFRVVGEARAGAAGDVRVEQGTVAYITTGAPLPEGADAVVQIEDTERTPGDSVVTVLKPASAGQDIRKVGSDITKGQVCLEAGTRIGPAECGILATVGADQVPVFRQPVVAVLSSGDELVEPDCRTLGPGQIRDSNRAMLIAACTAAGASVVDIGIANDQDSTVEACFSKALASGAHIILSSGGVSMGDKDLIKPLLEREGTVHFGRVLMKPGKPLTFATLHKAHDRRVLFFGLPGNPVSSIVCFHLVVRYSIRKLAGAPTPGLRRVHVFLDSAIVLDKERPEYHRVTITWEPQAEGGRFVAASTGGQRSSRLLSVRSSNGLLELPRGSDEQPEMARGSFVPCLLIDDLREMPQ